MHRTPHTRSKSNVSAPQEPGKLLDRYSRWLEKRLGKQLDVPVDGDHAVHLATQQRGAPRQHRAVIRAPNIRNKQGETLFRPRDVERMLLVGEVAKPFSCSIPLRSSIKPVGDSEDPEKIQEFRNNVRRQYATRYLEHIGLTPNEKNIRKMLREMPVRDDMIHEFYVSRGWVQDYVMVDPGPLIKEPRWSLRQTRFRSFSNGAKIDAGLRERALEKLLEEEDVKDVREAARRKLEMRLPELPARPSTATSDGAPLPIPRTAIVLQNMEAEGHQELAVPFICPDRDIHAFQKQFVAMFPFDEFEGQVSLADRRLAIAVVVSKYQFELVCHAARLCYHAHMAAHAAPYLEHPLSSEELDAAEKESYVNANRAFATIEAKLRHRRNAVVFHLPLVLLCLRVSIEGLMRKYYTNFMELHPDVLRAMTKLLSNMFDPDRYRSHVTVLDAQLADDPRFDHPRRERENLNHNYFTTSASTQALFPEPAHPRTRQIFARDKKKNTDIPSTLRRGMNMEQRQQLHRQLADKLSHNGERAEILPAPEAPEPAPAPRVPKRRREKLLPPTVADTHALLKTLAQEANSKITAFKRHRLPADKDEEELARELADLEKRVKAEMSYNELSQQIDDEIMLIPRTPTPEDELGLPDPAEIAEEEWELPPLDELEPEYRALLAPDALLRARERRGSVGPPGSRGPPVMTVDAAKDAT